MSKCDEHFDIKDLLDVLILKTLKEVNLKRDVKVLSLINIMCEKDLEDNISEYEISKAAYDILASNYSKFDYTTRHITLVKLIIIILNSADIDDDIEIYITAHNHIN